MKRFTINTGIVLVLGLGIALALLWGLEGGNTPAVAAPVLSTDVPSVVEGPRTVDHIEVPNAPTAELHVCLSGCAYSSVQDAVDAANPGDVIKVATGIYTSVQERPAPAGYNGPSVITQVVYISKTVTVRGGYTTAFTDPPDPEANPTTLDAQGQGRVLCITGDISPTVEGLRITGGDAVGLGGCPWGNDAGGGAFLSDSAATLSSNTISSNTAGYGGGLYLFSSDATLEGNAVSANSAGSGGGLSLFSSAATLEGNAVTFNTARDGVGGGLLLYESAVTLSRNTISANNADGPGGGLWLYYSDATLSGNTVTFNTAAAGGGGLYLEEHSDATLINNIVADNQVSGAGSGLCVYASALRLLHTTIARNSGGSGNGIYIDDDLGTYSTVALTNTILVSQTVGINVRAGNTATLEGTLWGSGAWANDTDWGGDGTVITGTVNVWDDPAFVDPDAGDYHITIDSAAVDAGVDAGVPDDIDGDPRTDGSPDIGADEFSASALVVTKQAEPDPVQSGGQLTYTIHITNTGTMTLTATVTDTLPDDITQGQTSGGTLIVPGGIITWTPVVIVPRDVWSYTFVVTVEVGYTGPLTNVVQVTTEEGATGIYTETSTVTDEPITGLAAINDSPTPLGQPTTLTATIIAGSNVSYIWAFGDGETGSGAVVTHTYPNIAVFTAVVTASNSVSVFTETTTITITDAPIVGLDATNDSPTALGDVTTLTATITAGSNVSYAWTFGDGEIGSGAVVTHTYPYVNVFTAVVTASNSVSVFTETTTITITDAPIFGFDATNDSPTKLGDATTLTAIITAGSNVSYAWTFGDGETGSGAVVTHTYPYVGVFTAVVTASNSVSLFTDTTTITITDVPIVGLAASNDSPTKLGDATTLTASITAGSNVSYAWTFGDGEIGSGAVVTHTYPYVNVFTAVVTASNSLSLFTETTTVTITTADFYIYLPSVLRNH